jgi:hypothetical protein
MMPMGCPKPSMPASRMGSEHVPRYFLSLRYKDGIDGLAVDEEGDELPNEGVLREHVLETARDLLQTRSEVRWLDSTFEVTDEAGHLVLAMPLTEAVK